MRSQSGRETEGRAAEGQRAGEQEVKRGVGRPSNILKLVEDRSLPERIGKIAEYHQAAKLCYSQSALYVIMCGFELHAARAQIGHGGWEKWVHENCPFTTQTAWNYLQAAERKAKDIPNLQRVGDFALGVSPLQLTAHQQADLFEIIHQATNEQTARQLYLELGLMKNPEARQGTAAATGKPSVMDQLEAQRLSAHKHWISKVCGQQMCGRFTKDSWRLLSPEDLETLRNVLSNLLQDIKEHQQEKAEG